MKKHTLALALGLAILAGCGMPASQQADSTTNDTTADSTTPQANTPLPDPTTAERQAIAPNNWPMEEWVELTPTMLDGLCSNKYGCLQERLYPLGWSEDGKMAYLIERTNEAVNNFTLTLFVQDMNTNRVVAEKTFKASEQKGYSEEIQHTVQTVWAAQADAFNALLDAHQVRRANATQFYPGATIPVAGKPFQIGRDAKIAKQELFDVDVLTQSTLFLTDANGNRKEVNNYKFGKYNMVLAAKALGHFRSLDGRHIAIVDGWERRGYEGPPNVLKINIVGYDSSK